MNTADIYLDPRLNRYLDRMDATWLKIQDIKAGRVWEDSKTLRRLEARYDRQALAYRQARRRIEQEDRKPRQLQLFEEALL